MTIINGKNVTVNKPVSQVYNFLLDLNNFKQLLPEDKISNWESTSESCSFKIQNVATIGLSLNNKIENKEVKLVSTDKSPFSFDLTIMLTEMGDNSCKVDQVCNADINSFLKMMVEKPLTALFDHIADKLVIALK
jgi:carbon monoxide dehydrogenase subunit G